MGLEQNTVDTACDDNGQSFVWVPASGGGTSFSIIPINDAIGEGDETIEVSLSGVDASLAYCDGTCDDGCGGGCCGGGIHEVDYHVDPNQLPSTITIQDDDNWAIKAVRTSAADGIVERNGAAAFSFMRVDDGSGRSGDMSYAIAVDYTMSGDAIEGVDYYLTEAPDGTGVGLTTINDHWREADKTATLVVSSAQSVPDQYGRFAGGVYGKDMTSPDPSVMILDDDWWKVGITASPMVPAEPDTTFEETFDGKFSLARDPDRSVTYAMDDSYPLEVLAVPSGDATYGTDYSVCPGNSSGSNIIFTIPAGATSETIDMTVHNDPLVEDDEDVTISLTGPVPSSPVFAVDSLNGSADTFIVDNDHWLVSVVASDAVATERMQDLDADNDGDSWEELDLGEFTFSRYGMRGGDVTYGVEVTFTIAEQTDPRDSATPGEDYTFSLSDPNDPNATYLDTFTLTNTVVGATETVRTYEGTIPVDKISARLGIIPNFDWNDEGDLYDPNGGGSPLGQLGETVDINDITDIDWNGLNVPGTTRIGNPRDATVDIKDGAILEVYLDYGGDGSLDARLSVDDVPCFVPLNEDDDNLNYASDKDEYPGHPADYAGVSGEDDLVTSKAYAWIEEVGQFTFTVDLSFPSAIVKLWEEPNKITVLDPNPYQVGVLASAGADASLDFWTEGISVGQTSASLTALRFENATRSAINEGTDTATLMPGFDLDIDSDNNGGIEGSSTEEFLEDHDYGLGKMLHYSAGENHPEPVVLRLPPGMAAYEDQLEITFDFDPADLTVWVETSAGPVLLANAEQVFWSLAALDYDNGTGLIELAISANRDTLLKTYTDTATVPRPTRDFKSTLRYSIEDQNTGTLTPAYTLTDTVQYIIAPNNTFYRVMNANKDLRQMLAAQAVYGDTDPKQYCLQPQDAELLDRLGFDASVAETGLDPDASDGYAAVLYRDFCDLEYTLAFAGTDFTTLEDVAANIANGTAVGSAQTFKAVSIAAHIAGDHNVHTLNEIGTAEENRLSEHVTIVGHSLGGAIASAAGVMTGLPTVTFNSAGITPALLQSLHAMLQTAWGDGDWKDAFQSRIDTLTADPAIDNVVRYAMKWDILTQAQKYVTLMPQAVGKIVSLGTTFSDDLTSQYDVQIETELWGGSTRAGHLPGVLQALNGLVDGFSTLSFSDYLAACRAIPFWDVVTVPGNCHFRDQLIYGILTAHGVPHVFE